MQFSQTLLSQMAFLFETLLNCSCREKAKDCVLTVQNSRAIIKVMKVNCNHVAEIQMSVHCIVDVLSRLYLHSGQIVNATGIGVHTICLLNSVGWHDAKQTLLA